MANDIYTTTLGELAELVSPRVAEGVLNRALRAVDRTPDDVDARVMSRLIRGRVRRELERSLPPAGLRRSLARVERRMLAVDDRPWKAKKPDARAAVPATDAAPARVVEWRREPADDGDPAQRIRAFPIADDLPDEAASDAGRHPSPPGEHATAAVGAGRTSTTAPTASTTVAEPATKTAHAAPAAVSSVAAPRPARPLPEGAIDRLAALSGVRQWVWASEGAVQGQGEGPAPSDVAGDVRATIALLSRHGRVRSLHVHHDAGHVLVGVSERSALVVSGDEGVNLGAVYTALRALEEAP